MIFKDETELIIILAILIKIELVVGLDVAHKVVDYFLFIDSNASAKMSGQFLKIVKTNVSLK